MNKENKETNRAGKLFIFLKNEKATNAYQNKDEKFHLLSEAYL